MLTHLYLQPLKEFTEYANVTLARLYSPPDLLNVRLKVRRVKGSDNQRRLKVSFDDEHSPLTVADAGTDVLPELPV